MLKTLLNTILGIFLFSSTCFANIDQGDLVINGLELGKSEITAVLETFGQPIYVSRSQEPPTLDYKFSSGIRLSTITDAGGRDRLVYVVIPCKGYYTSRNIQVGDTIQKVIETYESPTSVVVSGGCLYYAYYLNNSRLERIVFGVKEGYVFEIRFSMLPFGT